MGLVTYTEAVHLSCGLRLSMVGPPRGPGGLAQRAQGQRVRPTPGRLRKVQLSPCGPARIWCGGPTPGLFPLRVLSDVRKPGEGALKESGRNSPAQSQGPAPGRARKPGTHAPTGSQSWGSSFCALVTSFRSSGFSCSLCTNCISK